MKQKSRNACGKDSSRGILKIVEEDGILLRYEVQGRTLILVFEAGAESDAYSLNYDIVELCMESFEAVPVEALEENLRDEIWIRADAQDVEISGMAIDPPVKARLEKRTERSPNQEDLKTKYAHLKESHDYWQKEQHKLSLSSRRLVQTLESFLLKESHSLDSKREFFKGSKPKRAAICDAKLEVLRAVQNLVSENPVY